MAEAGIGIADALLLIGPSVYSYRQYLRMFLSIIACFSPRVAGALKTCHFLATWQRMLVLRVRYLCCDYKSLVGIVQECARSRDVRARFVCSFISG